MDAEEARTIGKRVRYIRRARRKSLRVIAGLSGMSTATLHRIETGKRALDRRSEITALANALQIAPSELTKLPVPAPANGGTDSAIESVRLALMAVSRDRPRGQVVSVQELEARINGLHLPKGAVSPDAGAVLPDLIRDLQSTIAAGNHVQQLLRLAVLFYAQDVRGWLWLQSAPLDLRWQAATLAQQAAQDLDQPTALGVAAWGSVIEIIAGGGFDLAASELDSVIVSTDSHESMQLAGMLALERSLIAASANQSNEIEPPLEYAADLARHTGQGNAYLMGFGPTNVGLWRMHAALESGDYDRAISVAERLRPQEHPSVERQATYWVDYGRALARIRGREHDAVAAFSRGEALHPARLLRNPFALDVLAELVVRGRRDAVGRELRGMAYRAGLPGV